MWIFIYEHVYTYIMNIWIIIYKYIYGEYHFRESRDTLGNVYMYMNIYLWIIGICEYVYRYIYIYLCIWIHIYMHMYIYLYICIYKSIYMYIYINEYITTYIFMEYIYIHMVLWRKCMEWTREKWEIYYDEYM
jgi:cytochrome P450 family 4